MWTKHANLRVLTSNQCTQLYQRYSKYQLMYPTVFCENIMILTECEQITQI